MNGKALKKDFKMLNEDVRNGKHEKSTTQVTQPKQGKSTDRIYRVSQELRSLLRDLIPELILSQKFIHTLVQFATVQEL